MSIKQRITLSNILMVLVPMALILAVSAALYFSYIRLYAAPERALTEEAKKASQAQHLIRSMSNQMEYAQNSEAVETLQKELEAQLLGVGYYLQVLEEDQILKSNLPEKAEEVLKEAAVQNQGMPSFFTMESDKMALIQNRFFVDNKTYYVIAINPDYVPIQMDTGRQVKMAYSYVGIILIFAFLIILFVNGIIASRLAKRLVAPLDLLSYGAGQIKDGNLDFEIRYEEKDEFGQVCSDFNQMRLRLKESVNAQIAYEEDRKELIAGVSHDLRTPLTAIKGYVKGILDGVANTPEKQTRYLEITYAQTCNMDRLVDKLFLFSKLDTGHFPFQFETIELRDYMKSFIAEKQEEFLPKGLTLWLDDQCGEQAFVKMDIGEMRRVLSNILDNSAKYKNKEQGNVGLKLYCESQIYDKSMGTKPHPSMFVIEIEDDGPGVEDKHLKSLFKSFYRADPSRAGASESSGLGLCIAERIVTAHGGEITAQNGKGLCIKIKLPMVKGAQN